MSITSTTNARRPAFILNPTSGSGRAATSWAALENRVTERFGQRGVGWELYLTQRPGHASELALQAIEDGWTVVVSIGGDGTHNEVVNGYLQADGRKARVEMAIMSFGTGGDLHRTLFADCIEPVDYLELIATGDSIPADAGYVVSTCLDAGRRVEPKPCSDTACPETPTPSSYDYATPSSSSSPSPLLSGYGTDSSTPSVSEMADDDSNPINQVDFADGPGATEQPPQPQQRNGAVSAAMLDPSAPVIMEGQPNTQTRYFLNISSCGIGGVIVHGVNSSSKALGGFMSFIYQTCLQTLLWSNKPIEYRVDNENEWRKTNVYQLVMANARYHGGGVYIAPDAEIFDGYFQVVELRDIGVADIQVLFQVYSGSHMTYDKVSSRHARYVEARSASEEEVLIEIDGENGGKLPASWNILPESVQLIVPPTIYHRYQRYLSENPSPSAPFNSDRDDATGATNGIKRERSSPIAATPPSEAFSTPTSPDYVADGSGVSSFSGVGDGIGFTENQLSSPSTSSTSMLSLL